MVEKPIVTPARLRSQIALSAFVAISLLVSCDAAHDGLSNADIPSLSLDELTQIEVSTPGKVPETIRETPASVRVVDRDEIETLGYQSLTEVLEDVP